VAPRRTRRCGTIVDRHFQFGLALRLLLVVTVFFLVGLALVFAPSFYLLASTNDPKALENAATEFLLLHKRIWPAAILSFAAVFVFALRFSHRIAGPVYRINAVLRQFLRDEYPERITFRKNDYFVSTAALLEQLSAKMKDGIGRRGGDTRSDAP
jgi:hypothetical protein